MLTSPFDVIQDILLKTSGGTLYQDINFEKHMIPRLLIHSLSMKSSLLEYAELLNKYDYTLSKKQLYLLAYNLIPKQNNSKIYYIKKNEKQ